MFTRKKTSTTPLVLNQEKFDTLIGRHAQIHGCLKLQESVRIDGQVVGNIEAPNDDSISVVIGPTGEVMGDVSASRILVAGRGRAISTPLIGWRSWPVRWFRGMSAMHPWRWSTGPGCWA